MPNEIDFTVLDEGSVVLITPMTAVCKEWVDDNVETEDWQWMGAAFAVEHRQADDLITGMLAEGFHSRPMRRTVRARFQFDHDADGARNEDY